MSNSSSSRSCRCYCFIMLVLAAAPSGCICQSTGPNEPCQSANRSSFMWKIHREPPAYLLGTIHVPYTAVWGSFSPAVKLALDAVPTVYFELDLTREETVQELARCQLIEDAGTQLEDLVPGGLVERIDHYLSAVSQQLLQQHQSSSSPSASSPASSAAAVFAALSANWRRRRPVWLALMLASLTPRDLAHFGTEVLDVFLTRRAKLRGQRVMALETLDDQCSPLNAVPADEAALALNLTLGHLEGQLLATKIGDAVEEEAAADTELVRGYRCGQLDSLVAKAGFLPAGMVARLRGAELSRYRRLARRLRRWLVRRRNRRMAQRVVEAMAENGGGEAMLFAVGIGHLIGDEETVVHHLRAAGYKVEPMQWNQTPDSSLQRLSTVRQQQPQQPWSLGYSDSGKSPEQLAAASRADKEIWEKAKQFARLRWQKLKADRQSQPQDTGGPAADRMLDPSIGVIKSAVSTLTPGSHGSVLSMLLLHFAVAICLPH